MIDGWVRLDGYATRVEADLARVVLEAAGIEARVDADDVAGAYPSMQTTTRLLVREGELDRAREALRVNEAHPLVSEDVEESLATLDAAEQEVSSRRGPPASFFGAPPEVALGLFLFGLALGFLFARAGLFSANFVIAWTGDAVVSDLNADGRPDEWYRFFGGEPASLQQDRNHDGEIDFWLDYADGRAKSSRQDDDFDGRVDLWIDYVPSGVAEVRYDADGNGVPDVVESFEHGVITRIDFAPNGGPVERQEHYEGGIKRDEVTLDATGEAVSTRFFDVFGREVVDGDER